MLDRAEPPAFLRRARGERKIEHSVPIIHAMLEADRQPPRKQRHTAQQIYDRLRAEHQYDGKLTIIKDAARTWRKFHGKTFVPLAHPPGEAQVDLGEAQFWLDRRRR